MKVECFEVLIYETNMSVEHFSRSRVLYDLSEFKLIIDAIVANRYSYEWQDAAFIVFTLVLFWCNS